MASAAIITHANHIVGASALTEVLWSPSLLAWTLTALISLISALNPVELTRKAPEGLQQLESAISLIESATLLTQASKSMQKVALQQQL